MEAPASVGGRAADFMSLAGIQIPRDGGRVPHILTEPTPRELVDAVEQNCIDFFMEYGRGRGCEVHTEHGVTWFATGIPHALFNGVMTAHLAADEIDARIDELIAEHRARNVPLEWTVGTSTVPADLGRHLEAKGLRRVLAVPGMAMPLGRLPEERLPEGLTIEAVDNRAGLEEALRIALATFEIPTSLVPRLADLEESMPRDHRERTQIFLGRLRGRPVASSEFFGSAGVAGIYFVGTLPGVRGRGIARAMTLAALREGKHRGFRMGALQATAMGVPVYRRLGFRDVSEFAIYF